MEWLAGLFHPHSVFQALVSLTGIWRALGLGLGCSLAAGPCGGGFSGSERDGEMGGATAVATVVVVTVTAVAVTSVGWRWHGDCGPGGETDGGGVSGSGGGGRELGESQGGGKTVSSSSPLNIRGAVGGSLLWLPG